MTIQEARALKPGEKSSDGDYVRASDGELYRNSSEDAGFVCRECPFYGDGCDARGAKGFHCEPDEGPWLKVPAYQTKPSKEWSLEDWKEAAEAGAYVEGTYSGKIAKGTLLAKYHAQGKVVSFCLKTGRPFSCEPHAIKDPDGSYVWNLTGGMPVPVTTYALSAGTDSTAFEVVDNPNTKPLSNPGASVSGTGVSQTKPGEGTSPTQERDINMSNLTKSEKAAASNSNVQAFAALSYGVQAILRKAFEQDPSALQYLNEDGQWKRCTNATFGANKIYRVNPDAQTAPEQRKLELLANGSGDYVVQGYSAFAGMGLFAIAANKNTIGIVYEKYGIRTTKTSLNLEFGTPVAVIVKG